MVWTDIAFVPRTQCPLLDPTSIATDWKATITQSAKDQITVTWEHRAGQLHAAADRRHPNDQRRGHGGLDGFWNSGTIVVRPIAAKR